MRLSIIYHLSLLISMTSVSGFDYDDPIQLTDGEQKVSMQVGGVGPGLGWS